MPNSQNSGTFKTKQGWQSEQLGCSWESTAGLCQLASEDVAQLMHAPLLAAQDMVRTVLPADTCILHAQAQSLHSMLLTNDTACTAQLASILVPAARGEQEARHAAVEQARQSAAGQP